MKGGNRKNGWKYDMATCVYMATCAVPYRRRYLRDKNLTSKYLHIIANFVGLLLSFDEL